MKDKIKTGYSDRLAAAAEARKAQLAKFKPKPAVMATDTTAEFKTREQIKAEEREAFRLARIKAKEDAALAVQTDKVRIAEGADRRRAVLFPPRPQVAAGKPAEDRRAPRLAALTLKREEHFLDRVAHAPARHCS